MSKSLRILLLEDDPEDALLFQRRCPPGFRVQHVSDSVAALEILRGGSIDVCFTDYRLGANTGLDLVRTARAEGQRVPIIVITGQDLESLGENALLAGATDFVPKDDLDTVTLGRITRWSLIRRHVENRREDSMREAAITQLMGHAPRPVPSSTPATAETALRRLLYLSLARRPISAQDLMAMSCSFAARNAIVHITGVLVCAGNRFMQVIEGERNAIVVLMQRIGRDSRHGDIAVVVDESVQARLFAHWNMGCLHLSDRCEETPANWISIPAQVQRLLGPGGISREGIGELIRALPGLLRARPAPLAD